MLYSATFASYLPMRQQEHYEETHMLDLRSLKRQQKTIYLAKILKAYWMDDSTTDTVEEKISIESERILNSVRGESRQSSFYDSSFDDAKIVPEEVTLFSASPSRDRALGWNEIGGIL
uniref:Uncharacterized protein n=1 Tax=Ascaris lumbricoides TaxID=6252 RepID=A0A0M3IVA0_ASCLU